MTVLESWRERLEGRDIAMVIGGHHGQPGGSKYIKSPLTCE